MRRIKVVVRGEAKMVVVSPFSGKKNAWCLCGINVAVVNGSSLLSVSVELDLCYTDPADHLTTVGYQDRDEPVCMPRKTP